VAIDPIERPEGEGPVVSPRVTTRQAVPSFGAHRPQRPRVLIEEAGHGGADLVASSLRGAGYDVAVCGGPEQLSRRRCPLEEGTVCPAVAQADVVVASLRAGTGRQVGIVAALRHRYPATPVVVLAASVVAHRHRKLLEGCHVVAPHHRGDLARILDDLVGGHAGRQVAVRATYSQGSVTRSR
jgi:CheY-like chemotaxis protein